MNAIFKEEVKKKAKSTCVFKVVLQLYGSVYRNIRTFFHSCLYTSNQQKITDISVVIVVIDFSQRLTAEDNFGRKINPDKLSFRLNLNKIH